MHTVPAGGRTVLSGLRKEAPESLGSGGHDACNSRSKSSMCTHRESNGQNARREACVCSLCYFQPSCRFKVSGKRQTKAMTNTPEVPLVRLAITMFTGLSRGGQEGSTLQFGGRRTDCPTSNGCCEEPQWPRRMGQLLPGAASCATGALAASGSVTPEWRR